MLLLRLGNEIKHLTSSVRTALADCNWYSALGLALTLPDICARVEEPGSRGRSGYVRWFDKHVAPKYTHMVGAEQELTTFLGGKDCYALRCAVLHEGRDDVSGHEVREVVDSFAFLAPTPGLVVHGNSNDRKLQLQVDLFCVDVCDSTDKWLVDVVQTNPEMRSRVESLMRITTFSAADSSWLGISYS